MGRSTPTIAFDGAMIQCRHIEHMHGGVYNFLCTDSTEIFFSKLRSAGLNFTLTSFSLNLSVRGVSNKHCLLTFFHLCCPYFRYCGIVCVYTMYKASC